MVRILLTHPHRLYPPLSSSCHVNSWSTSADTTVNSVQAVSLSPYWPVRCISHRALLFRLFDVFEYHNSLQSMMATPSGFEPELCESKSHVLPLHQGAIFQVALTMTVKVNIFLINLALLQCLLYATYFLL